MGHSQRHLNSASLSAKSSIKSNYSVLLRRVLISSVKAVLPDKTPLLKREAPSLKMIYLTLKYFM